MPLSEAPSPQRFEKFSTPIHHAHIHLVKPFSAYKITFWHVIHSGIVSLYVVFLLPSCISQQSTARKIAKLLRLETSTSVIDAIDCNAQDDDDDGYRIENSADGSTDNTNINRSKLGDHYCDGIYIKSKWNGVKLCTFEWKCSSEPTALMFICHDYGEHAQRCV